MPNNDNSGVLFKNDNKREGKQDADYTGNITINGSEFWLNAWVNESKGKKYISLKAKAKTAKAETKADDLGEIPF